MIHIIKQWWIIMFGARKIDTSNYVFEYNSKGKPIMKRKS